MNEFQALYESLMLLVMRHRWQCIHNNVSCCVRAQCISTGLESRGQHQEKGSDGVLCLCVLPLMAMSHSDES